MSSRCGPSYDNKVCVRGRCCSKHGWCGVGTHCTTEHGFNGRFDGPSASSPNPNPDPNPESQDDSWFSTSTKIIMGLSLYVCCLLCIIALWIYFYMNSEETEITYYR